MSSIMCPREYGKASTGSSISVFFIAFMALSSTLLSGVNVFGCVFPIFALAETQLARILVQIV